MNFHTILYMFSYITGIISFFEIHNAYKDRGKQLN